MKGITRLLKKSRSGATLMLVIGTFSILLILVTASLSAATMSRRQTFAAYNKSQSYYVANSAVNSFVNGLNEDTGLRNMVLGLSTGESYVSKRYAVPHMGEIEYRIKRNDSDLIVVTATSYYNYTSSQSSVILSGQLTNPKIPNFSAATVTFSATEFANNFKATGDVVGRSGADGYFHMTNVVGLLGNVYVDGNLKMDSHVKIQPGTNDKKFTIETTGDIEMTNSVSVIAPAYIPKTYINTQGLTCSSNVTIGSPEKKINVYAHSFYTTNSTVTIYSDVMLYKKDGVAPSYINGSGTFVLNGDIYIEGDYIVPANSNVLLNGNLHVTGTLTVSPSASIRADNIMCNELIANTGSIVTNSVYTPNAIGGTNGGALASKQTWNDATDSKLIAMPRRPKVDDPDDVFAPYTLTEAEFQAYLNNDMFLPGRVKDFGSGNVDITESCTLVGDSWGKTLNITVGDDPIWINLKTSLKNVNFNLVMNDAKPDTPVFFYVPKDTTVEVMDARIMSKQTIAKINNGDTFYSGNYANPSVELTKGQPIYWMIDDNAKIRAINSCIMEGYFYAPFSSGGGKNIDLSNQNDGTKVKVSTDGLPVVGDGIKPKLVGAIVVNGAQVVNDAQIVFLVPTVSGIPGVGPGADASDFKIESYTRK